MKRGNNDFWKSLFCLFRVHNADYYMQEAKKLKHKADALVGFLPLIAFLPLRYYGLKENKEGTLQLSQTFSLLLWHREIRDD